MFPCLGDGNLTGKDMSHTKLIPVSIALRD